MDTDCKQWESRTLTGAGLTNSLLTRTLFTMSPTSHPEAWLNEQTANAKATTGGFVSLAERLYHIGNHRFSKVRLAVPLGNRLQRSSNIL